MRNQPVLALSVASFLSIASLSAFAAGPEMVFTRVKAIPEAGTVTEDVLLTPAHELSFEPPPGWREIVDKDEVRVSWTDLQYNATIALRVFPKTDSTDKLDSARLREKVQARFAESVFVEETGVHTGSGHGIAVDVTYQVLNRYPMKSRVASVPLNGDQQLELTLTCPPETFSKLTYRANMILNSFKIKPRSPE